MLPVLAVVVREVEKGGEREESGAPPGHHAMCRGRGDSQSHRDPRVHLWTK